VQVPSEIIAVCVIGTFIIVLLAALDVIQL
jgi:hypothetical protein